MQDILILFMKKIHYWMFTILIRAIKGNIVHSLRLKLVPAKLKIETNECKIGMGGILCP